MIRIVIYIIILVTVLIFKNRIESYREIFNPTNQRSLLVNENVSINININELRIHLENMNKMIECIECNIENKQCEFNPSEIFGLNDLNLHKMISILYESYINNFQDIYLINRFNINKYVTIIYQQPEDNYNELINLYDTLKTNILFISNNIDDNLYQKIFSSTNENISMNLQSLETIYDTVSSKNEFLIDDVNIIINNLIDNYLKNILNSGFFNIKKSSSNNENHLAYFEPKQVNENNMIDTIEAIERMLENEINESQIITNN